MSTLTATKPTFSKLVAAGMAGIAGALVANLVTLFLLRPLLNLDPSFLPFTPGPIILFTTAFTFIGWLVFLLVHRVAKNPMRVYLVIAVAALLLSIIPNLAAMANPASMPMGGDGRNYGILIIFHVTGFIGYMLLLLRVMGRKSA